MDVRSSVECSTSHDTFVAVVAIVSKVTAVTLKESMKKLIHMKLDKRKEK